MSTRELKKSWMEDLNVLPDLRELNTEQSAKFNTFWEECAMFLNEDVGRAVDDRRHGQATHLARAISIRNQVEHVKAHCKWNPNSKC